MKSLWKEIIRWIKRRPLSAIGLLVFLSLVWIALFAPVLPIHSFTAVNVQEKLLPPSLAHPMGTDDMGRDILSRVIYGARTSLMVGAAVVLGASFLGTSIGLFSGYFGGFIDEVMMRITDSFLAFPAFILAMALAVAFGTGVVPTILALCLVWWPWYARLARAETIRLKEAGFVEAAKALGASGWRILYTHILPNSLSPLIVQATLDMGYAILTTSGLSFIGLGVQEPTPEWGAMLNIGRRYLLSSWWFITFPGLAIFLTVLAINLVGDGLRDFLDPRTRRQGI